MAAQKRNARGPIQYISPEEREQNMDAASQVFQDKMGGVVQKEETGTGDQRRVKYIWTPKDKKFTLVLHYSLRKGTMFPSTTQQLSDQAASEFLSSIVAKGKSRSFVRHNFSSGQIINQIEDIVSPSCYTKFEAKMATGYLNYVLEAIYTRQFGHADKEFVSRMGLFFNTCYSRAVDLMQKFEGLSPETFKTSVDKITEMKDTNDRLSEESQSLVSQGVEMFEDVDRNAKNEQDVLLARAKQVYPGVNIYPHSAGMLRFVSEIPESQYKAIQENGTEAAKSRITVEGKKYYQASVVRVAPTGRVLSFSQFSSMKVRGREESKLISYNQYPEVDGNKTIFDLTMEYWRLTDPASMSELVYYMMLEMKNDRTCSFCPKQGEQTKALCMSETLMGAIAVASMRYGSMSFDMDSFSKLADVDLTSQSSS